MAAKQEIEDEARGGPAPAQLKEKAKGTDAVLDVGEVTKILISDHFCVRLSILDQKFTSEGGGRV